MELRLRRRRSGESLATLHQDIRRLNVLAHPTFPSEARDVMACDYFVDALDDPEMALKVRQRVPKSLDDALHLALRLEAWAKDAQRQTSEVEVRRNRDKGTARSADSGAKSTSELEDKLVNALNRGMAKWTKELRSMGSDSSPNNGGNVKQNQPKPETEEKSNVGAEALAKKENNTEVSVSPKTPWAPKVPNTTRYFECYKCGKLGYMQRDCPEKVAPKEMSETPVKGSLHGAHLIDKALSLIHI